MKVLARANGFLWRSAEWLVVTLGLGWLVLWAFTFGRQTRRRALPEQLGHRSGG